MIPRGRGKIINIASVQSELARPGIAPYTATKGAVRNLTKGMCTDWAKHGLQVNAIAPGYFRTELNQALVDDPEFSAWLDKRTPAGRWGDVRNLSARRCSWRPTRRPSSTAICSMWTGASPPRSELRRSHRLRPAGSSREQDRLDQAMHLQRLPPADARLAPGFR